MNIWDILLLAAIGTALFLAVRALTRHKSCGCTGCESCTAAPIAEKTNAIKNRNHKKQRGKHAVCLLSFFCTTKRLYTYCVVPPVILHIFHRVFPK